MSQLYIVRLFDDVHLPSKATEFSAGFDIHAYVKNETNSTIVKPGTSELIPTGLIMRPEENMCIKLFPRSGLALKHRIALGNCVGLGDSDYPSEYKVIIYNHGSEDFEVLHEMRICQIKVERVEHIELKEVKELPPMFISSSRSGGFGSTGTRPNLTPTPVYPEKKKS